MPEILQDKVSAQDDPSLSTQTGEKEADSSVEPTRLQSDGQTDKSDEKIGPDNLPPELEETRKNLLRDYHGKLQRVNEEKLRLESDYQSAKNEQATFRQLLAQEWFKKAAEEERSRRQGRATETSLSDEEFEAAKTDKQAFLRLVSGMADRMISSKIEPVVNAQAQRVQELEYEREFESAASKFKDFRDVNDKGLLDPYLESGHDYEAAYKQYKFDSGMNDIDNKANERAREILQESRNGSIGKGGSTQAKGNKILEANTLDEAFDLAWGEASRGNKDFTINKKK